jgi:hypothetical protein
MGAVVEADLQHPGLAMEIEFGGGGHGLLQEVA